VRPSQPGTQDSPAKNSTFSGALRTARGPAAPAKSEIFFFGIRVRSADCDLDRVIRKVSHHETDAGPAQIKVHVLDVSQNDIRQHVVNEGHKILILVLERGLRRMWNREGRRVSHGAHFFHPLPPRNPVLRQQIHVLEARISRPVIAPTEISPRPKKLRNAKLKILFQHS
jgi:hypothetical protein